jgi:hypothetical protein
MLWCGLFAGLVLLIVLQTKLYGCDLKKLRHLKTLFRQGEVLPADGTAKQE